jgi:glucose-6-phosphate isomerase
MLQLWREGPIDKVIGFVDVSDNSDIQLGKHALGDSQSWLAGQSLRSLLQAERAATEKAVQDAGQATWAMTLPALDAHSIGQFIALWQVTVAFAGRLMNLNPYDQPGVELGKEFTRNAFD